MRDELCEQYGYARKHAIKRQGDGLPRDAVELESGVEGQTGALQDNSRGSVVLGQRASVLECGGPPPLLTSHPQAGISRLRPTVGGDNYSP